jgi:prepilin-type processing-associated H-X9-DG protein
MSASDHRQPPTIDPGDPRPQDPWGCWSIVRVCILLGVVVAIAIALLLPAVRSAREPARRAQCKNQLRQIALALHQYAEQHGGLPPAYTTGADGRPLHSWRTLILPYLQEAELYDSIDLTKPWDDPVNAAAFNTKLEIYQCPSARWEPDNRTIYLAVVTPESCIQPTEPRKLSDVTDGTSRTLMVVETDEAHAVPWMSPVDADEKTVLGLGGPGAGTSHPNGVNAVFVDGSVHFLHGEMPAKLRRALISIAGNDEISLDGDE